jgi:hypothetical protein
MNIFTARGLEFYDRKVTTTTTTPTTTTPTTNITITIIAPLSS